MKESRFTIVPNILQGHREGDLVALEAQEGDLLTAAELLAEDGYEVVSVSVIPPHGDFLLHAVKETDDER